MNGLSWITVFLAFICSHDAQQYGIFKYANMPKNGYNTFFNAPQHSDNLPHYEEKKIKKADFDHLMNAYMKLKNIVEYLMNVYKSESKSNQPYEPNHEINESKYDSYQPRYDSYQPRYDSYQPKYDRYNQYKSLYDPYKPGYSSYDYTNYGSHYSLKNYFSKRKSYSSRDTRPSQYEYDSYQPRYDSYQPRYDSYQPKYDRYNQYKSLYDPYKPGYSSYDYTNYGSHYSLKNYFSKRYSYSFRDTRPSQYDYAVNLNKKITICNSVFQKNTIKFNFNNNHYFFQFSDDRFSHSIRKEPSLYPYTPSETISFIPICSVCLLINSCRTYSIIICYFHRLLVKI